MDKAFVIEAFANMGFTALDVKEMFNRDGYKIIKFKKFRNFLNFEFGCVI